MATKVPLAAERTRRFAFAVVVVAALALYFSEYGLWLVLYLYDKFQILGGIDPAPALTFQDLCVLALGFAIALYPYLFPRHYVRIEPYQNEAAVFHSGKRAAEMPAADLSELEVIYDSRRATRSSPYVSYICIASTLHPKIVFFDGPPTRYHWREKRMAKMLEARLGQINWVDPDGVL